MLHKKFYGENKLNYNSNTVLLTLPTLACKQPFLAASFNFLFGINFVKNNSYNNTIMITTGGYNKDELVLSVW